LRIAIGLCAALLLLSGCANRALRPDHTADALAGETALSARESALFERDRFDLSGRIAISDGKDGGSGRFEWTQRGRAYSLRFVAPITAQSWRLEVQPGQALLVESNGAVRVADSAEVLLQRELNWKLPAEALRYWVLGMRAPGSSSELEFSADGQLALLRQSGWEIRYLDFDRKQDPPLPRKVFARSGEHQVRISVRRWAVQ
jgi:outer membrane lipoprotein LolB